MFRTCFSTALLMQDTKNNVLLYSPMSTCLDRGPLAELAEMDCFQARLCGGTATWIVTITSYSSA